jgi:hypothetical protein
MSLAALGSRACLIDYLLLPVFAPYDWASKGAQRRREYQLWDRVSPNGRAARRIWRFQPERMVLRWLSNFSISILVSKR